MDRKTAGQVLGAPGKLAMFARRVVGYRAVRG